MRETIQCIQGILNNISRFPIRKFTGQKAVSPFTQIAKKKKKLKPCHWESYIWQNYLQKWERCEKEIATHSSILAWEIPWTEEPGRLHPWGCRVGHGWSDWACTHALPSTPLSTSWLFQGGGVGGNWLDLGGLITLSGQSVAPKAWQKDELSQANFHSQKVYGK